MFQPEDVDYAPEETIFFAEATPKTIMRTMGVKGLTLFHLKSHLQVYALTFNYKLFASASYHNDIFTFLIIFRAI